MRVVIAEDEALLRAGLVRLLGEAGLDVVGTAGDAPGLLELVELTRPDVVVTDIRMPPTHTDDGLRAALDIRKLHPGTGVVVLSQFAQRRYAIELVGDHLGGVGYLLKQQIADVGQFCADVRRVAEGGLALDPEIVQLMVGRAVRSPGSRVEDLTGRQREVLALLAEGRSNAAIAARLGVSVKAVVQHVSHIYETLDLPPHPDDHRRVLAVVHYLASWPSSPRPAPG